MTNLADREGRMKFALPEWARFTAMVCPTTKGHQVSRCGRKATNPVFSPFRPVEPTARGAFL